MCCARTAALHCGNEKQKVNASGVLQQSLHHVKKCRQERNICPHIANVGSKIEAGAPQGHPDATKRRPRATKRYPKDIQEPPRDAQERPRGAQENPKNNENAALRRPDHSKIDPGTPQDVSWARFWREPLFERLWKEISE